MTAKLLSLLSIIAHPNQTFQLGSR